MIDLIKNAGSHSEQQTYFRLLGKYRIITKIRKLENGDIIVVMVKAEDWTREGMHEVGVLNHIL